MRALSHIIERHYQYRQLSVFGTAVYPRRFSLQLSLSITVKYRRQVFKGFYYYHNTGHFGATI